MKTEEEIRIRDRYHRYFDLLEGGVCIVLADGTERVAFASNPTAVLYECGDEEEFLNLISSSFRNMMVPEDYKPLAGIAKDHPEHFYFSFHYQTKENHFRKTECAGSLKNTSFGMAYVIQIFSSEQISSDRTADGKTGLPGMHQFFGEALFRMKEQMRLHQASSFCPVSFDVTNFKEYNRLYGMSQGDQCLEKIAETITGCFPGSLAGHLTADHFVALLPEKNLREKLEYVCNEVNRFIGDDGIRIKAGVYPASEKDSIDDLRHSFDMAKIACDTIKQDGNRSVVFYHPAMGKIIANRTYILRHFAEALEKHYIRVYYQPVVGSLSGMTCGYEALSRWIDPEKGMITPGEYIPYLEKTGEVYRLDLEILEQVCRNIHDHREQFSDKIFVNINLSQTDFQFADIPEAIRRIVSKYGIAAGQIQLEITESAFADSRILGDALNKLQKDGFRIWMDDFGVGESSLSTLRSDQIKGVKLDQSFFADIENPRTQIIIRSVIDLSHETHCMIIAEGIENREQERCAQQWGVNFIQGYYHSKPLPFEELMNSSFVRNQTDENTDQYYRAAVEANLSLAYQPEFYIRDGSPAFFGSAVLECGDKLRILRMNDQMKAYLGDVVRENRSGYVLDENSVVVTVLKNAAEEAEKRGRPVDFRMDLKNRRLYGQIAGLAENPGCGKTAFVLHLSDFFLATE